ncbi:hypothetical protein [Streptomyces sp. NPDC006134]|uniref:hypothetical protein n=1 Tax=Streptomyces sp. NPDC006134 TaxID=3154467 RepID=UPI0033F2FCE0
MVRSGRLRFTEKPRTAVRFPGTGERVSTSHSDRTRLPDKVTPGREYRDTTVAYHLATRLTGGPEGGRNDGDGTGA